MLCRDRVYETVPWFWSDQHDLILQMAGLLCNDAPVVTRPFNDGTFVDFPFNNIGVQRVHHCAKNHNVKSVDEVKHRVEQEFLPQLKQNPGFRGYYLIDCASPEAGNILTSISMFDSWDAALASNDAAKKFIKHRLSDLLPEPAPSCRWRSYRERI